MAESIAVPDSAFVMDTDDGARREQSDLLALAEEAGRVLTERGWSVAVAESCTGGLVTKLLTDVPGSSRYVRGGMVAYSNDAKERLLGVKRASIVENGAVSGAVALEMAVGAGRELDADVALGITGVAGPGGGTPEKPVGTVWFGFVADGRVYTCRHLFPGDRSEVRRAAARTALTLIRERVAAEE